MHTDRYPDTILIKFQTDNPIRLDILCAMSRNFFCSDSVLVTPHVYLLLVLIIMENVYFINNWSV